MTKVAPKILKVGPLVCRLVVVVMPTFPELLCVCKLAGGPGSSWCVVYCWGAGLSRPTLLPRPNTDVHITQVSVGRQQMVAVTRTGRLLLWEVWSRSCN